MALYFYIVALVAFCSASLKVLILVFEQQSRSSESLREMAAEERSEARRLDKMKCECCCSSGI